MSAPEPPSHDDDPAIRTETINRTLALERAAAMRRTLDEQRKIELSPDEFAEERRKVVAEYRIDSSLQKIVAPGR